MNDLKTNSLVCPVCGEELRQSDNFCPGCGASIKQSKDIENKGNVIENIKEPGPSKEKKNFRKKSGKESTVDKAEPEFKKIPVTKLIYLIIGLMVIVLLINYIGGVFEKPVPSDVASNTKFDDVHKGVDLQNLQQINSLEEKVKNNPADKTSLLELAHMLNDSGFKERAVDKYKIYLKIEPQNADVLVDMGVCYYELRNYNEAIKQMKQAIQYQPKHQIAHLNLGIVNMTNGNHDEAVKWWKQAVEINPNSDIAKRAQELINSH